MPSEPTKWEPSAASIENMLRATAEEQGYNFDEIPLGEIEDARRVAPIALKAAIAADPLLSAAAEMRDALEPELLEAIADELTGFEHSTRAASLRGLAKRQRAALAKAKGE